MVLVNAPEGEQPWEEGSEHECPRPGGIAARQTMEEQKRYKCCQCAFSHSKRDVADADSTVDFLAVDDAFDAQSVQSIAVSGKRCECAKDCMCQISSCIYSL